MPIHKIDGSVYVVEKFVKYKHTYIKAIDNNDTELLDYILENFSFNASHTLSVRQALEYAISCNNLYMTDYLIRNYIISKYPAEIEYLILKDLDSFANNIECNKEMIYYFFELYQ